MTATSGLTLINGLTGVNGLSRFAGETGLRGVTGYTGTPGTAPTITSDGGGATAAVSVSVPDTAVTTVTATGTAPVSFMISGGADAALFQIDAADGTLSFIDPSTDGAFVVVVAATNQAGVDTQTITVTAATYHASAVHFDGSAKLSIASLTSTDNTVISWSVWLRPSDLSVAPAVWASDETDGQTSQFKIGADSSAQYYLSNAAFSPYYEVDGDADLVPLNVWTHLLVSVNTGFGAGNKIQTMYVNDVLVTPGFINDGEGSLTLEFNGKDFHFCFDGLATFFTGDVALAWVAPGVSLLSGTTIPEATRRLFISASGKPVDPSGYPASRVFFNGDAASFSTNQGTGGAFTLTGNLTNASTSPSD